MRPTVQPEIRSARPEDLDALHAVLTEAFAEGKAFSSDYIANPHDGHFLVVVVDEDGQETVAGCVLFDPGPAEPSFGPRTAALNWLAVRSRFRGRHYGEALLREAEARAQRAGAVRISATVMSDNPHAMPLCLRLGYRDRTNGETSLRFLEKSLVTTNGDDSQQQ